MFDACRSSYLHTIKTDFIIVYPTLLCFRSRNPKKATELNEEPLPVHSKVKHGIKYQHLLIFYVHYK